MSTTLHTIQVLHNLLICYVDTPNFSHDASDFAIMDQYEREYRPRFDQIPHCQVIFLPAYMSVSKDEVAYDSLIVNVDVGNLPNSKATEYCQDIAEALKKQYNIPIVVLPQRN